MSVIHPRGPVAGYVGAFYLVMAGINIGCVVTDPTVYETMADGGLLPVVRSGWQDVVMAAPEVWIGLLAAGEIAIGVALLLPQPWPRVGYLAAIVFHLCLMLLGWGFWLWAAPALVVLVLAARHDGVLVRSKGPRSADLRR